LTAESSWPRASSSRIKKDERLAWLAPKDGLPPAARCQSRLLARDKGGHVQTQREERGGEGQGAGGKESGECKLEVVITHELPQRATARLLKRWCRTSIPRELMRWALPLFAPSRGRSFGYWESLLHGPISSAYNLLRSSRSPC